MAKKYQYQKHDTICVVNEDDPDLVPVEIHLPEPPPLREIDGYGMAPEDQVFTRPVFPTKLLLLAKRFRTIEECFMEMRKQKDFYSEEIKFIQREWDRRMHGYWFFNNGKPTYIAGVHYFYLVYWHHGNKKPDYRSRDRKFYLFLMMCLLDPFCAGMNYPKFRREGATSKVACFIYWLSGQEKNKHFGIQSKDDDSAAEVFTEHIVNAHKKMAFWFKPKSSGKTDPKRDLQFKSVSETISKKGTQLVEQDSLESFIDFGPSTEGYYDRAKLRVHYSDEEGKTIEANIYNRFNKIKPALQDGNLYIGIHIGTTTVGEMVKGGGENYKQKIEGSMYHERGSDGETSTGLYNLFISSMEGLNIEDKVSGIKFIDKFGNSDREKTKKYLEDKRKGFLEKGDIAGYNEFCRQYPIYLKECFRTATIGCNFNEKILMDRIEEFRFGNPHKIRGNFEWKSGKKLKDVLLQYESTGILEEVVWNPSSKGKFFVSYLPPQSMSNKFVNISQTRIPGLKHLFVAGGDTFKVDKAKYHRSNGGGAIYAKFDMSRDDINGDPEQWVTDDFCCTYSFRPPTVEDYCEDMLLMCMYYGCQMFPEINVDAILRNFKKWGFAGYLYHQTDIKTGKMNKVAGGYTSSTSQTSQENIYGAYTYWIEHRAKYSKHEEILEQCLEVREDMMNFDLFVAAGYSLMAATRQENQPLQVVKIPQYHRKFSYNK